MSAEINCDMGESFGLYRMGDDEGIMPCISQANVACGFHGSDPNHMRRTVELARRHGVKVGAHFSLPDLPGFGRREMKIERDEMFNIILYQIGALTGFLQAAGLALSHLKPHGALYGMATREEHIAHAIADAAEIFDVPVLGLAGTLHEEVYRARGVGFLAEFFADLDYGDDGSLIITREHHAVDPQVAARRTVSAVREGRVPSINGNPVPVRAETVCIHSDTPNAVEIARAVHAAISRPEGA
ncbi:5-oxoprolinase subunit PxpA [Stappia stellulata]|uniref:5-oxoprolinase subunit PxpA n=1 Tax=Stappia TaxID=152161 RepID=UPI001CD23612|nr:5-oxoprolinase subunit PxpA [Stappia stellulata]MCA1242086.1 5-oxoprolinase subunit PxpA [Stappia stellulata]